MDKLNKSPEMDFSTSGNIAERWRMWKQTVELNLDVTMSGKHEPEKCKAFLYIIGKEGKKYLTLLFFQRRKGQIHAFVNQI